MKPRPANPATCIHLGALSPPPGLPPGPWESLPLRGHFSFRVCAVQQGLHDPVLGWFFSRVTAHSFPMFRVHSAILSRPQTKFAALVLHARSVVLTVKGEEWERCVVPNSWSMLSPSMSPSHVPPTRRQEMRIRVCVVDTPSGNHVIIYGQIAKL